MTYGTSVIRLKCRSSLKWCFPPPRKVGKVTIWPWPWQCWFDLNQTIKISIKYDGWKVCKFTIINTCISFDVNCLTTSNNYITNNMCSNNFCVRMHTFLLTWYKTRSQKYYNIQLFLLNRGKVICIWCC